MWAKVIGLNHARQYGVAANECGDRFIFSRNYPPVADARIGDILSFNVAPPRAGDMSQALNPRIIGYTVLEDGPSQQSDAVETQITPKEHVNGIPNSTRPSI